ncbi:MAG TPA: hypothetical protein VGJ95_15360 [Pseudonocardiaceae bacterium]
MSIIFANPSSPVWRDLRMNRAFLDQRSGEKWDLFFAGMSGYRPMDRRAIPIADPSWHWEWTRYVNPEYFDEVERGVSDGHRIALEAAGRRNQAAWRYRGGTELISFMVYDGEPDWLSLVAVPLDGPADTLRPGRSLTEITEGLRNWQTDELDRELAPGEAPVCSAMRLPDALRWSANAVAGGVLGNAVYELLKQIFY